MRIKIKLFASLRERFKTTSFERDMPAGASVQSVIDALRASVPDGGELGRLHVAVNKHYVDFDTLLNDGDEVAIFPPVSGGSEDKRFLISEDELSLDALAALVTAPERGAIVLFSGTVRGVTGTQDTDYLEYEAYVDMAEKMLTQIGAEVQERWPQVLDIAIAHRMGRLEVGESSVMIAVAAAHRQGIFEAGAFAIERLKQIAPIWKKEVGPDGQYWVEGPRAEGAPPST